MYGHRAVFQMLFSTPGTCSGLYKTHIITPFSKIYARPGQCEWGSGKGGVGFSICGVPKWMQRTLLLASPKASWTYPRSEQQTYGHCVLGLRLPVWTSLVSKRLRSNQEWYKFPEDRESGSGNQELVRAQLKQVKLNVNDHITRSQNIVMHLISSPWLICLTFQWSWHICVAGKPKAEGCPTLMLLFGAERKIRELKNDTMQIIC